MLNKKVCLKIVKEYFKEDVCNFTSTSWNTRPFKEAKGITKFHQDRDGYKILKIFIYLNDTFETSGPHVFAVGSHRKKILKFIPQYRYDDNEVKKHYKELKTFCGKKDYASLKTQLVFTEEHLQLIKQEVY